MTVRAKYVFFDVVGFTHERSVEAQTYIVEVMNAIVQGSLAEMVIDEEERILIPTGDGVCVALLNVDTPYDIEVKVALAILRRLSEHNNMCEDESRRFEVRIGINENIDNMVVDVNGHRNMAGAGISLAARIMDLADGRQVLVSQTVYDRLRGRERYMQAFRGYRAVVKHRNAFMVFQYLSDDVDTNVPEQFRPPEPQAKRLPLEVAFYIVESRLNRESLMKHRDIVEGFTAVLVLWFRALDSADAYKAKATELPRRRLTKSGATFEEQYVEFRAYPVQIMIEFAREIEVNHLAPFRALFEDADSPIGNRFANELGVERVRAEWPDIAIGLE